MKENKPTNFEEYLVAFPPEVQKRLKQLQKTIKNAAPGAIEKISYGLPTFFLKGNLVHFGAFKNHLGLYATPTGHKEFEEELSPYVSGKGSVQFPNDQPLPTDLIGRIVKFRVEENLEKGRKKKGG